MEPVPILCDNSPRCSATCLEAGVAESRHIERSGKALAGRLLLAPRYNRRAHPDWAESRRECRLAMGNKTSIHPAALDGQGADAAACRGAGRRGRGVLAR